MRQNVLLLRNSKLSNKLCKRLNTDFGCKSAFGCNLACPLWIAAQIEMLMNSKGMTLGEAYKATIRMFVGNDEDKMKILVEAIKKEKEYPESKSLREVLNENK